MVVGSELMRQSRREFVAAFRRSRHRSMREFAEQEIIIPNGPFEGQKFSVDRQPFARHWFAAADDQWWKEIVATGPSQTGKTLLCFVIPVLFHLFELKQDVIAAVPDQEMVRDKWQMDIEPVLALTRYAEYMPTVGSGSRGGKVTSIRFHNGRVLRFMTSGGKDKSRAGFTAPVVCMTETDGFDERVSTSDEADKIAQIEARVRAFLNTDQWRIYKECTVTTDEGHTWQRYQSGTASKIMLHCVHCKQFVEMERANFTGWQHAADELEAVEKAGFFCSQCGEEWSETDRQQANIHSIILHRGQRIENGKIAGDLPRTQTLGFRWSAVHNLLVSKASLAKSEYKAARSDDEDNAEREMCQFVWCVPYRPKDDTEVALTAETILQRVAGTARGVIPDGATVTIGIDVNKTVLHWTAIAWSSDKGTVIDYGKTGVKADEAGFALAVQESIRHLHSKFGTTWSKATYHQVYVDSRWETDAVVAAIRALRDKRWRPFFGLGQGHWSKRSYTHPTAHSKRDVWIGNRCYERVMETQKAIAMFADANFWKTWLHARIALEPSQEGAIMLYEAMEAGEHQAFAKHLTAEREQQVFERGRGYVKVWDAIRSANHWLDSTYMACVGGHRHGFGAKKQKTSGGGMRVADVDGDGFGAPVFER